MWGTAFFYQGTWRVVQERERLLGFLKASRIQIFISFCSARIQASPSRISLSSFSMFPAFIFPAWRRNEVEFGRFIVFEGKSRNRTYLNRRVTNEWFPLPSGLPGGRGAATRAADCREYGASKAAFANGRACCGSAIDHASHLPIRCRRRIAEAPHGIALGQVALFYSMSLRRAGIAV
jgi:hypothetical protein